MKNKKARRYCECLARLAISDKIPKCPITQLSNSSSDYLTLKTKTLFLIFKCVRKVGEIVFGIRFLFPYFYIDPGTGEIDSTNLFLNQISAIKLRASFYTLKSNILSFFCCETAKNMERVAATPCVFHFLISFPNLGVFYCKENSLILMFSKLVFNVFS